jgi:formylglycine-generating enzyme required for sulfatase activity
MRFPIKTAYFLFQLLSSSAMAESFQNGGFEQPGLSPQGTHIFVEYNEIAGWMKTGPGFLGVVNGRAGAQQFDPIDGNQHLNFNGGDTPTGAILSQTFDTKVGETYEVCFFVGRVFGSPNSGDVALTARVLDSGDNVLHSQRVTPPLALGYGPVSRFRFTATSSSSTLSFEDTSAVTVAVDVALDAVSVTPVQPPLAADPVVTNVQSRQIPGTYKVEILYNLVAGGACTVAAEVSNDGGASYIVDVPPEAFSGAIGAGVLAGSGKSVVFDAANSPLKHLFSKQIRFRVSANNGPRATDGFAFIPSGTFQMGDAFGEGWSGEVPVHSVYVSAFHMGKYEVTKALWDEVRTWGLIHEYTDLTVGNGRAPDHPVHTITWYDMVKWCNARNEMEDLVPCYYSDAAQTAASIYRTGSVNIDNTMVKWSANGYRLPTEAEWEKAARGGISGKRFPWGDTINHTFANFYNSDYSYEFPQNQGYHPAYAVNDVPYTSPVGSFSANGYGLYDMAGNLWEWCWDWYGSYPSEPQTDPRGADSNTIRVIHGSCWNNDAFSARCAHRNNHWPSSASNDVGFRLARAHL